MILDSKAPIRVPEQMSVGGGVWNVYVSADETDGGMKSGMM